jgi:lantibiotic modifying enzyme
MLASKTTGVNFFKNQLPHSYIYPYLFGQKNMRSHFIIGVFLFLGTGLFGQAQFDGLIFRIHNWLAEHAIREDQTTAWAVAPDEDSTVSHPDLYSGSPGVVLFYLEASHSLNNPDFLRTARKGANYLVDHLPDSLSTKGNSGSAGLYTGLAGVAFTLKQVFNVSRDAKYLEGYERCLELLRSSATISGDTARWGTVTDIISGNAGIGLFMLSAYKETEDEKWRTLAKQIGNGLLGQAIKVNSKQLKWPMEPAYNRIMPNFSHGTAGVAYFLTKLYIATGIIKYLNAAIAAANYLKSIETKDHLICHHEDGDGKSLYYLGFCHGPAGTARLYAALYQATAKKEWEDAMYACTEPILKSGIPEKQTPGFWNNISQCCGNAGVAEFFLSMYQLKKDSTYKDFAWKMTQDLLQKGTSKERGIKWIQAENRKNPDQVVAQTGYMQGAAGVGILLLHWMELTQENGRLIHFPDDPY